MQSTTSTGTVPSCRWFPLLKRNNTVPANEDVRYLQRCLNANGASVSTDGKFGPRTEAAVKTFQAQQGLVQDGIVGVQTWQKLSVCTTVF